MPDWFGADKFDRAFRTAVRHCNISVAAKNGDNLYILTRDGIELEADTSFARKEYMRTRSQLAAERFADEMDYRFSLEERLCSFTNAQSYLRLIALKENELEDGMIYAGFAGSLKKAVCFAGDRNDVHTLNEKYLRRWNVPREVLFAVSDRNMGRVLSRTDFNYTEIVEGVNVVEFEAKGDALVVSLMMCTDFREFITEKLGSRFLVAAPSRETLLAVHEIPDDIYISLTEAVDKDYKWADDPLTTDIFYYTPDGITVTGRV